MHVINLMQANGFDTPVSLDREGDQYVVTYGKHRYAVTDLTDAMNEFRNCAGHSARCAGLFDHDDVY